MDFTVHFTGDITVNISSGTPYLPVIIGIQTVNAQYLSGSDTSSLVFMHTVKAGEVDSDGIAVGSTIPSNGGTLKDSVSNNANLALNSIASTNGILVNAPSQPGTIQFNQAAVSVNENAGTETLTVTRTVGSDGAVAVYAATDGTATGGGVDYTLANGTLSFADGDTRKTITVAIVND